jgi:hypothetical protein
VFDPPGGIILARTSDASSERASGCQLLEFYNDFGKKWPHGVWVLDLHQEARKVPNVDMEVLP